jgi:hypothetical protein
MNTKLNLESLKAQIIGKSKKESPKKCRHTERLSSVEQQQGQRERETEKKEEKRDQRGLFKFKLW